MDEPSPKPILEIRNITKNFGGLTALNDVSFDLHPGEILGVIGPNGAGKTTLFDVITGRYRPSGGKVFHKGEDITGLKPHQIVQKGISRSFQLEVLFKNLSVFKHLVMSRHLHTQVGFWGSFFRTPGNRKEEEATEAEALELMRFVGLEVQGDRLGGNLSHGYQKSLGIAMALGPAPEILLLDEPLSALSPKRVTDILDLIRAIRDKGVTVMVIEHNMGALFRICDRVVVLSVGEKIAEGLPEEIKHNQRVIEAYLGGAVRA
ncbi:MAG: ATP-binding cassette domain-containing protein [Proteobacteria bacterium]|nr:ATP-binding cassette domain-containing protein [Pseudomonadota bacterium]NIS68908.1 ATP-binding cassette domain-containing protein [Pseudomonadota bacterium]